MNRGQFQNRIIKLIPSLTIREYLSNNKYDFSDFDLLQIIDRYSTTWEEMIELYNISLSIFKDKSLKGFIKRILAFENKQYNEFFSNQDDCIFQLTIHETTSSHPEVYLLPTYDDCFITIKSFFRNYKDIGTCKSNKTYFEIEKKTVKVYKTSKDFSNDEPSVVLSHNFQLKRIYTGLQLPRLNDVALGETGIKYPPIFKKYDLLAKTFNSYHLVKNDKIEYYINSFDNGSIDDEACLLELDNEYVDYRCIEQKDEEGYYPYYMCHTHEDYGLLEKINIDDLDSHIKDNVNYVIKTLKIIEEERNA